MFFLFTFGSVSCVLFKLEFYLSYPCFVGVRLVLPCFGVSGWVLSLAALYCLAPLAGHVATAFLKG